ncbi:YceI family protein [Prolixibacteraceae bacterium JC049]|nr:YceI family protein [Prolixibacteraceae bacterium JC049]
MKKTVFTFIFLVLIALGSYAQKFMLDSSESMVKWTGEKISGKHYGNIMLKSAELTVEDKMITAGEFVIDMKTITCTDLENESWNKKLVDHLNSEDFFHIEKYPTAKFVLKSVQKMSGNNYRVKGDLTIKDVTRPYGFKAEIMKMNGKYLLSGTMVVDRSDYGVKYGSKKFFKNLGDKIIYDDFKLEFKLLMK